MRFSHAFLTLQPYPPNTRAPGDMIYCVPSGADYSLQCDGMPDSPVSPSPRLPVSPSPRLTSLQVFERKFTPSVIEPSFGIGRIIYCVLEHVYGNGSHPLAHL